MPTCAECYCFIKKDFSTSILCNKTYHPGCARSYLGSKSAQGCCLASLSNSHQRSNLTTMTEPVYNTASGTPSDSPIPLFSFSSELTLPQQHLQAAAVSGASASLVSQKQQQAATIPVSMPSEPQQHPQTTTVSDGMSRFNNLDSEAKMPRMYEFIFTHMRGLESRLNEVARTTSERFSQVDARLQALEQRAVEQTFRPHESTAEIIVSGLPTRGQLSYGEIVTSIFNFIGANRFLGDLISIKKLNTVKENGSLSTPDGGTATLMSFSLILRFKSVQVRNEVMRLKILKGNIPVVTVSPNLPDLAENKVFLNKFLTKEVHKLLRLVRARAKARNYEWVWVRNEQIFVRKNSDSEVIPISSESDLNKFI